MPLLSCDCNRLTKRKLEDENRTETFFHVSMASLPDEK